MTYRHKEQFQIRRTDGGPDFRVRIQSICNYMEEAAGAHAAALGVGIEDFVSQGKAWVLAKLRIVIHRLPAPLETLTLETWPSAVERLQFRREFLFTDASNRLVIAAVTRWVIIDMQSRKLVHIPQAAVLGAGNSEFSSVDGEIKIPAVQGGVSGPAFRVRLADIDQIQHVNNVRYVDFALEAAHAYFSAQGEVREDACLLPSRSLRGVDVLFRAEGHFGDTIMSSSKQEENTGDTCCLLHSLFRRGTGTELARVRTVWSA